MATLLRQQRQCAACTTRRHCMLTQLLLPRLENKAPFYEWFEAWLCTPCRAPITDLFRRGHQAILEERTRVTA